MTVTFIERRKDQCCAPISGDGPGMLVCGEPVARGVYCEAHYRVFYYPVTKAVVRTVKAIANNSGRQQRMTLLQQD